MSVAARSANTPADRSKQPPQLSPMAAPAALCLPPDATLGLLLRFVARKPGKSHFLCHQTQLSADFCVSWQRAHHERRHLANHLSRTATKHLNRNLTGKHRPMGGQPEGLCCPHHRSGRAGGHICRPWCVCPGAPAEVNLRRRVRSAFNKADNN